ncbi:MAG: hypothetical protein QOE95_973 [Gaiellaceae bacterium]|nr:hypothetical protein [Gaiellaceae bacterium]
MSRGWKIGIALVVGVIVFDLALKALQNYTGGTPGGPTSSSYATAAGGLRAYAELLAREGHPISRVRTYPHEAALDPASTVVVLDPPLVTRADAAALRLFVEGGGRLIAGGSGSGWLRTLLAPAPTRDQLSRISVATPIAPAAELAGVARVRARGSGGWASAGAALPVLGNDRAALVDVATIGKGRLLLLADPTPLQNGLLGAADNARLGLNLAGASGRPVAFLEAYHGYGKASGLRAIPFLWKLLLAGLVLATLTYMVARGRRLGPPEAEARELAPPRRVYVESLAGTLGKTRRPAEAVAPLQRHVRKAVAERGGLRPDTDDAAVRAAAASLGLSHTEIDAMLMDASTDSQVIAAGRALARLERERSGTRA